MQLRHLQQILFQDNNELALFGGSIRNIRYYFIAELAVICEEKRTGVPSGCLLHVFGGRENPMQMQNVEMHVKTQFLITLFSYCSAHSDVHCVFIGHASCVSKATYENKKNPKKYTSSIRTRDRQRIKLKPTKPDERNAGNGVHKVWARKLIHLTGK